LREQRRRRQDPPPASANLGVEVELDDIKSSADLARHEKDIGIVLKASEIKIIATDGEAGASSRQNDDIEEQETGVESVSKLPRIVPIVNYAGGGRRVYSTALNRPRGTTFGSLRYRRGSISMGRSDISLQIQATPPR